MVPIEKVQDIIDKHSALEKELSTGNINQSHLQKIKRVFKFR